MALVLPECGWSTTFPFRPRTKPRPGLLDFKRVVEPLRIRVAEDWSGFTLWNGYDYADTSALAFRYVVESDRRQARRRVSSGSAGVAQSRAAVSLPADAGCPAG